MSVSTVSFPLPVQRLLDAVRVDDPVTCLHVLAHCQPADVNFKHMDVNGGSPLHLACSMGLTVIVQLLVWVSTTQLVVMGGVAGGRGSGSTCFTSRC